MIKIVRCILFFTIPITSLSILSKTYTNECHYQATSKTTLANSQAPFSSVSPELVAGFRNERVYARNDINHYAMEYALFGSASTHATKKNLAHYFFPNNQTCLSCADDDLANNFNKKKDLLAQNFNVFTKDGNFRSEISIAPEQSMIGAGILWRQSLLHDPLKGNGVWISASTPLVHLRNRMNFQETISNNGGGVDSSASTSVVANMQEAFVQPDWLFGKISNCTMKKTALADIELKVGYDQYLPDEPSRIALYTGIIIPTSNKNKGEYVFEPIVGRGKHAGLMFGGEFGKNICQSYISNQKCIWEIALHSEYLFKNKQIRSFDLQNKPWSRYLPLYKNKEQAQEAFDIRLTNPDQAHNLSTPGINILTQHVSVTPGFSYDMNTALIFEYTIGRLELGYNLFFKRAECVQLSCPWQPVVAIKYANGQGSTNPIRDISGNKYLEQVILNNSGVTLIPVSLTNFEDSLIYETDLDLLSASTPQLLSHTMYVAGGVCLDEKKYPTMINGGISYTFSPNNAVVTRWMMWAKGGLSF